MEIIIAYASAGAGHFKAAKAVHNYLKADKDFNPTLIDVLGQSNPVFSKFYRGGYDFIVRYFPSFWAFCYFITHTKALRPIAQRIRLAINLVNTKRFSRLLNEANPDCVLSTHFLASEVALHLKKKKKIKAKVFSVVTDFDVHSFWVAEGTDGYFVACDFTKAQLVKEGVSPRDIHVIGIPVDAKFYKTPPKGEIRAKLGIVQNAFTVLVMTGSFGIGPLEEIVDLLHQDAQLLVVCAKNEKLYSRLKNKSYPSVKVFAFVDNTEELMAAADVIVTKAGGLTISEFIVQEVVPIFICAIPGQEKKNIRVLLSYGIGREAKSCQQVKRQVVHYKEHPEDLVKIKENIRSLKKPFAVKELSDAIRQSGGGPAGRGPV